jgi:hypothetical protein
LLVAGLSVASDHRIERWLLIDELTAGPVLLLAMFAGSLLIGLRAQAPGPSRPSDGSPDLADRFRSVGPDVTAPVTTEPAVLNAPPEWIDRLAGVLLDNACRVRRPSRPGPRRRRDRREPGHPDR